MLTALPSRAVLRIAGPDCRTFLQGIVTQDIERLAPGEAAFAALLTPQGKILFDFFLFCAEDGFLLDCNAESAEALMKRLSLYRLRAKVTIAREEGLAVGAAWPDRPSVAGASAFPDPRATSLGWRLIGPREKIAGATGESAHDQRRIELGVPAFGRDFGSDEVFLTDVGYDALKAVDYKKGCFIGQEVSSRMKRKGEIRKRALVLRFDGPAPAKGTPVTAGDATLGDVLSGGDGAALALLRLDRLKTAEESGARIEAAGREVRIAVPAFLEQG